MEWSVRVVDREPALTLGLAGAHAQSDLIMRAPRGLRFVKPVFIFYLLLMKHVQHAKQC